MVVGVHTPTHAPLRGTSKTNPVRLIGVKYIGHPQALNRTIVTGVAAVGDGGTVETTVVCASAVDATISNRHNQNTAGGDPEPAMELRIL